MLGGKTVSWDGRIEGVGRAIVAIVRDKAAWQLYPNYWTFTHQAQPQVKGHFSDERTAKAEGRAGRLEWPQVGRLNVYQ